MKSSASSIGQVLAATAAIAILPLGAAAAGIAFTVVGILAVFVADYGRAIKPLGLSA